MDLRRVGTIGAANGSFAVRGTHTYTEEGKYTVAVQIADADGASLATTATARVADAPLNGSGSDFNATAGTAVTATVGAFMDTDPHAHLAGGGLGNDETGIIMWGDGTESAASITLDLATGVFSVSGTHVYAADGTFAVRAVITDFGGSSVELDGTATVAAASKLSSNGVGIDGIEGSQIADTVVASFADSDGDPISNFTASIQWGDGSTSSGALGESGGSFVVRGTHTYTEEGTYKVAVQITDADGASATASSTATIADAPLSGGGRGFAAGAGTAITTDVGTFTDADPNAHLAGGGLGSDETGIISWGDGTQSPASITLDVATGVFSVSGTHIYANGGTFAVKAIINDFGGSSVELDGTATVAAAPRAQSSGPAGDAQTSNGAAAATTRDSADLPAAALEPAINGFGRNLRKSRSARFSTVVATFTDSSNSASLHAGKAKGDTRIYPLGRRHDLDGNHSVQSENSRLHRPRKPPLRLDRRLFGRNRNHKFVGSVRDARRSGHRSLIGVTETRGNLRITSHGPSGSRQHESG